MFADRVLGRRGFAVESAAARVCREAGGRVSTNMFVRNMDLGVPRAADSRRLEVVVDGLPLFGGVQLAVDTTLVSALKGDGVPRRGAADRDGVALRLPPPTSPLARGEDVVHRPRSNLVLSEGQHQLARPQC